VTEQASIWSNTPRVLLVTPRYAPETGGVETHVAQVARRLAARGVCVTVLTTDRSGMLPPEESSGGVTVRRVRAWPKQRDYYFAPEVYRVIRQGQWDIVHVQSYHTFVAPLAMFAARRARLPYVVTFHGGGHSSRWRNWLRGAQHWALRPMLAHAVRLIAVAKFEIDFWSKRLKLPTDRFVFIPNGADLPVAQRTVISPATDRTLLVSLGRLERYKGHHRIIAALPYILQHNPNTLLWIAGNGPYEAALKQLARKLQVAEHVEIRAVPPTERIRMAEELSRATLVVLLSEYETQPIAVLEAAALGRPVLVADTSGLRELAQQGIAQAIPLNSTPQQIAEAVLDLIRVPAVPPSITLPTWDECAAKLGLLYQQVMQEIRCAS
jgi:glycosyltransferase involved in cell wall biosynthesis